MAQGTYGTGAVQYVPSVSPSDIHIDGKIGKDDSLAWASAPRFNMVNFWEGGWNGVGGVPVGATPDITTDARVLYANDTLYVFAQTEDYDLFFAPDTSAIGAPWESDIIFLGIDPAHAADYTEDGAYDGWPWHVDRDSIFAMRIWDRGVTRVLWTETDSSMVDVSDSSWINSALVIDQEAGTMTFEGAIAVPGLEAGSQIGFNIGGEAASLEIYENGDAGEGDYAWFSWQRAAAAGSDVITNPASYGTLIMLGADETAYGTGAAQYMPRVTPSFIQIDGKLGKDSLVWASATQLNMVNNWEGGWNKVGGVPVGPTPDITTDARVLYAPDTLYVWAHVEDYDLFFAPDTSSIGAPWESDLILLGIDPKHDASYLEEGANDGWPWHLGQDSIYALRIWDRGVTRVQWTEDDSSMVDVRNESWINSVLDIDQDAGTVTFEAAIYVPGLEPGSQIGFNIGGEAASLEVYQGGDAGEGDYAWYSWQKAAAPGSDILNRPDSYGTLIASAEFATGVDFGGGEELPKTFALQQNYPNPFRGSTTISYTLEH
ncbi:MAG TPA: hypothetical protein VFG50_04615, partial [Rhodothermales bacterium]|nr:hypothetical protein [Rhodothermales bacterium]